VKLARAIGLVSGLTVVSWLGVAAGVGLVLLFVGAVVAHIRGRVFYNIAFPALYLLLAVTAAAYMVHPVTETGMRVPGAREWEAVF
jgi:hypothetical protein